MQLLKGSRNAVALESPAYYRAYQPVLEVLKQMDLQKIHFMYVRSISYVFPIYYC